MRSRTLCLSVLLSSVCLQAQAPTNYQTNPKFQSSLAEARQLAKQRQTEFAIDDYKKASKIAQGKDARCLSELLDLQLKFGKDKDAAETAAALQSIASTPADKSYAETERGLALYRQAGDKEKADLLNAADASLKAAITDNPRNVTALYVDGQVLARLGQIDAARTQFKACLACINPQDPSYLRAQHFADDPTLSLHKMAPAFTVTALDGSQFNLDAMNGRVVLIDFWATWCGPCNEELPHMKKIAKEFAGEPLVIISVSWDRDETRWRNFIEKNEMTWVQYRDADQRLTNQFGVQSIPHYFTIDTDGVLTSEMLGSGSNVEGKLKKLLAQAKAAPRTDRAGN